MISNHLFDMVTSALSDACENSKLAKAKIPISHRNLNRLQFIINKPTADFDGNLNFLIDNLKEDNSELYSIFDAIFNKPHQSIDSLKEDLEKLRPEKPALPEEELILPEEDNNPLGKAEKLKKVYAQREKINLYSKQLEMDIFANKFIDSFIKKINDFEDEAGSKIHKEIDKLQKMHIGKLLPKDANLNEFYKQLAINPNHSKAFLQNQKAYLKAEMSSNFLKKLIDFLWLPSLPDAPRKKRINALEENIQLLEKTPSLFEENLHKTVLNNFKLMYAVALLGKHPSKATYENKIKLLLEEIKDTSPPAVEILNMGYNKYGKFSKELTKKDLEEGKTTVLQAVKDAKLNGLISKKDLHDLFSHRNFSSKLKARALNVLRTTSTVLIASIIGAIVIPPATALLLLVGITTLISF
ncbi:MULTISPECIES: hypothetical protein [Parachlamydia]|uniref:hypothetical protein n=1 Tax=Parachlamydia TaxID=83551 RepID=UPI00031D493F|nr:hypothetical protein [Parachlamydia acanthamoebae]